MELQIPHCICAEISAQGILRRKAQRDRENTAAVVRMEKGDDCRSRGVSGSYPYVGPFTGDKNKKA